MKKLYKKVCLAILLSLFSISQAQTTLVAGDLAIVGYLGNGTATGIDQFSFVLLRDISTNTVINFTENAWLRTTSTVGSWRTGEGTVTWTSQSNLSAGTEVTIIFDTTILTTSRFQGSNITAGTVTGTSFALSANGDQIIAYQGSAAAPIFITALHMNVYTGQVTGEPTTNTTDWDGAYSTANSSGLPTGLTNGVNAIWIGTQGDINSERDNMRLTCGILDLSTVAKIKNIVFNKANYTLSDNAPGFTIPTDCRYMDPTLHNENFDLNKSFSIYPNPFSDTINIESTIDFKIIDIYTALGEKVFSESFQNKINPSNLSSGIYFIKLINTTGNTITMKIIKD